MRTKRCSSAEVAKFSDYCSSNVRCDKFLSSSFGTDEGNSLYINEQKLQNGMLMAGDGAMKVAMDQRKMVLSRRIRTNRMLIGRCLGTRMRKGILRLSKTSLMGKLLILRVLGCH